MKSDQNRTHYSYQVYSGVGAANLSTSYKTVKVPVIDVLNDLIPQERFVFFERNVVLDTDHEVYFYAPMSDEEWDAEPYSQKELREIYARTFDRAAQLGLFEVFFTTEEYRRLARNHFGSTELCDIPIYVRD